jgi:hypothetical protein
LTFCENRNILRLEVKSMQKLNDLWNQEISPRVSRLLAAKNRGIKVGLIILSLPNGKLDIQYFVTPTEKMVLWPEVQTIEKEAQSVEETEMCGLDLEG